jgi:hypothetical protein
VFEKFFARNNSSLNMALSSLNMAPAPPENSPGACGTIDGILVNAQGGPMPNYKQRKKKAGRNKWKKLKAMRLSVEARRSGRERSRGPFRKGLADQPDRQLFKPGSANDLYSRKAA